MLRQRAGPGETARLRPRGRPGETAGERIAGLHRGWAIGDRCLRVMKYLCYLYIGSISASPTARPYPRNGHAIGDADIGP